jgi:mRNA interferase MazF
MLNTTSYSRGDVVLVNFVYSDETGTKRRPVLLLSTEAYHNGRQEAIVAAITSNTRRILTGDTLVSQWESVGQLCLSVVTGVLRTIKQEMVAGKLGSLTPGDLEVVEREVGNSLGLVN